MVSHCRVAVIGAGAAGLVAARELRKEGHEVVVYEKNDQVGGTWVYNPNVESDLVGLDPNRSIIHSSLYESLRINFPREAMGYLDFPFVIRQGHGRDPRRYPGRTEVLMYLQEFANRSRIEEMVRFNCEVISVEMADNNYKKWKVKSKKRFENESHEIFDAVVVCNGHNSQPRLADIPGINLWPGKQIHSHNYRIPMPFKDKVVVIIGNAQSAADISAEIAQVAKEVYIAVRSVPDDTCKRQPGFENIWRHSMIERCCEDGTMVFRDGSIILADVIMHCTGYKYRFPFLKINDVVTVNDNRVEPLYKHVFPPTLAPWLSFVGLPWKVLPFACYELQSKWLAGVLSGRILLPLEEKMMEDINTFYSKLEASNMPKRYTHNILLCQVCSVFSEIPMHAVIYLDCDSFWQPDYLDWLAEVCQCPSYEKWRVEMYYSTVKNAIKWPKTYRDKWEDHDLVLQAHNDFKKYIRLNSNL